MAEGGDTNSVVFHLCVNAKGARNQITALRSGDGWIQDVVGICAEVTWFYEEHFLEVGRVRPLLGGILFPSLSSLDVDSMYVPFSYNEIDLVVAISGGNKILGLNGFNFTFLKEFWPLFKLEVASMFADLFSNA